PEVEDDVDQRIEHRSQLGLLTPAAGEPAVRHVRERGDQVRDQRQHQVAIEQEQGEPGSDHHAEHGEHGGQVDRRERESIAVAQRSMPNVTTANTGSSQSEVSRKKSYARWRSRTTAIAAAIRNVAAKKASATVQI